MALDATFGPGITSCLNSIDIDSLRGLLCERSAEGIDTEQRKCKQTGQPTAISNVLRLSRNINRI